MDNLKDKSFVVVDLGSGSYLMENEGHEKFNEAPNPVTGKYYGYAPPKGKLNITKLGAKKNDTSVSGVMVIYVKKEEGSNNRYISSFIPNATIYSSPRIEKSLNRVIRTDGKLVHCSYSIESDDIRIIPNITSNRFVIKIKDFSISMFHPQRFYKGTYPELDRRIIEYLEHISSDEIEIDDNLFQQELQETSYVSIPKMKHNSSQQPEYSEGSNGKQVKKKVGVSKAALMIADYTCESSVGHKTFMNANGVPYMEGHHLIPCTPYNAASYWKELGVNIDCVENIIYLCPTCHRLLHYGNKEERNALLKKLYTLRKDKLNSIGITISIQELEALYN